MQTIRVLSRAHAELRDPLAGEVCVSIANPRQSPAQLAGYAAVLRLGFHDAERPGGNFSLMTQSQALELVEFCRVHRAAPLTVHCQFGASRSVAADLFLAAGLQRPLQLNEVDILRPNPGY